MDVLITFVFFYVPAIFVAVLMIGGAVRYTQKQLSQLPFKGFLVIGAGVLFFVGYTRVHLGFRVNEVRKHKLGASK